MATKIKINTNRLQSDAEQVNNCIAQMKAEMEKMQESVTRMDQMWDGDGSEAFKAAFASDMKMLSSMIQNLKKVYQFEQTAKSKYNSCEQKVAEMIHNIRV